MLRILLVEDNEMNRDMLARRLQNRGFEVQTATDGPQALALARMQMPDLILLDLSLPLIDGWEVARNLKGDVRTKCIPVIALTAHAMPGDREAALDAGCEDYDTKPIDLDRLLAKMSSLFAGKS
jgi:two-component system, cell cycle response regulator DivK